MYTCIYQGDLDYSHDQKIRAVQGLPICGNWHATIATDQGSIYGIGVSNIGPPVSGLVEMQKATGPCKCPQTLPMGEAFAITWLELSGNALRVFKGKEFNCLGKSTLATTQFATVYPKVLQSRWCSASQEGMMCAWLTTDNILSGQFFDRTLKAPGRVFQIAAAKAGRSDIYV